MNENEEYNGLNKGVAIILSILAFLEVGFLIVLPKLYLLLK